MAFDGVLGLVNPHFVGNALWTRVPLNKSFRVVVISLVQHRLSGGLNLLCQPIVDGVGREQSQAAVAVLCVVPGKEGL